jgi:hypothetical protein
MKKPAPKNVFAEIEVEDSDMIGKIGYSPASTTLRIWFKNSKNDSLALYEYDDVGATMFAMFLVAESKGRFFNSTIKGAYRSRRVSE